MLRSHCWLTCFPGFALVTAGELDTAGIPSWFTTAAFGGRVVTQVEALAPWFAEHGCSVALVRPDRYVFGVGATHVDAEALVERLGTQVGITGGTRLAA